MNIIFDGGIEGVRTAVCKPKTEDNMAISFAIHLQNELCNRKKICQTLP